MSNPRSIFLKSALLSLMAGTLLCSSGCFKVGPNYQQPTLAEDLQVKVNPENFQGIKAEQADISNWWKVFNDPLLTELISEAIANNHDLRIALSRVAEARAQLGISSSEMWFTVDGQGDIVRNQQSEAVIGSPQSATTNYGLSLDAAWEIDLFGRVRRGMEASEAEYQATEEELRSAHITLCAEVAKTYFSVRTMQARVSTTERNIIAQAKMVRLTKDLFENGLSSSMEVSQSIRVLATSQATLPPLRTQLQENLSGLAVLLGQEPGNLLTRLTPAQIVPLPPAQAAIGIPAEQIRKRPDVRIAERRLAAQTARIGVAKADLYPTFYLLGSIGTSSLSGSDLFSSNSTVYSFGPGVKMNIFNRGRTRELIKVQDARTEQALAFYEKTLISAVKDIEDSLVAYHEQQVQMVALDDALVAAKDTMEKAEYLYSTGLIDFYNVLDAEQALLETENQWEQGRGNTSALLARVYKAFAGGWPVPEPKPKVEGSEVE